ncbi:MAG: hypothetical protein HW383_495 [Candidatus Magasanikbacteria bacterium]|nr:hypothetical protein [Candidatus Magasanikbacteria bacterium]
MERKRLFILIGFILTALLIAVAIYYVFFKAAPTAVTPEVPGAPAVPGALPSAAEGKPITVVTPEVPTAPAVFVPSPVAAGGITRTVILNPTNTIAPQVASNGAITFLDESDGKFYAIAPNGTKKSLSDQTFSGASNVTWTPDSSKAVIQFPDNSKVLYDFTAKKQVTLPTHWDEFEFAPSGDTFVAKNLSLAPENRWLIASNPDGSGAKGITPIGENANKIQVSISPNDAVVAFGAIGEKLGGDRSQIIPIGRNNENFRGLTVEGLGFTPVWSPNGADVLYSVISAITDYKPITWIDVGSGPNTGANRRLVGLATWGDKCTFASADTVYCAVPDPDSLQPGIGFDRTQVGNTNDTIYKVDVKTGTKTIVAKPDVNVSVEKLQVSKDGSNLLFVAKESGALLSIALK